MDIQKTCGGIATPSLIRDRVRELREVSPDMRAVEIASALGISRQRVHQVLRDLGLQTAIRRPKIPCVHCGNATANGRSFCGPICRSRAAQTTFLCNGCGAVVTVLRSNLRARFRRGSRRIYCSRICKTSYSNSCNSSIGQRGGRHA